MTLSIDHGRVNVQKPGESSVSTTIPGHDISSIEITKRIQEWKDDSSINFYNDHAQYTGEITSGDKLSVILTINPAGRQGADDARFGEIRFGESTFGGRVLPISHRWRGWARSPQYEEDGAGMVSASIDAADFVFEVLSQRCWVYEEFTDRQIAGHEDAIVETLLRKHAPEIDTDLIEPVRQNIGLAIRGNDLLSVMQKLATRGDALLGSRGDSLIFRPVEKIQPSFELQYEDYGTATLSINDDSLKNAVRVEGGETPGQDEATAQDADDITGYAAVSDNKFVTAPLNPAKNKLMFIDVWTRHSEAAEDDDTIRARIQKPNTDNTGPIAPTDDRKDIDSGDTGIAISDAGWRLNISLSKEPLPDNAWLIIDASGSDGHEVGVVDDDNTPAFRTYYPHPILRTLADQGSIDEYRRREIRLKKEDIATNYRIASDIAESHIRHNKWPEKQLEIDAQSIRTHTMIPGQTLTIDRPDLAATGEFILTERSDEYSGESNLLNTSLTLQEVKSI